MQTKTNELLTIKELTSLLSIKESHLRSLIFRQEIPFIKVGRLIRFDQSQIQKWLEEKISE